MRAEATGVSHRGVHGSKNVGISNRNPDENSGHRKSKVSWAMTIIPGLVDPKARPKGVVDGQPVNIPAPKYYSMKGRILVVLAHYWICVGALKRPDRKIRPALL